MEWLFSWFDQVVRLLVMYSLWEKFEWVDGFALIFLVLGILYGLQNGLFRELAEILQILIVIYLVLEYWDKVKRLLLEYVKFLPEEAVNPAAFILTAVAVWVLAAVILRFFDRFFHAKTSRSMRLLGGGILGGIHLLIIFSFISQGIMKMPFKRTVKVYEAGNSYTGYYLANLAPKIHQMFAQPLKIFKGEQS